MWHLAHLLNIDVCFGSIDGSKDPSYKTAKLCFAPVENRCDKQIGH